MGQMLEWKESGIQVAVEVTDEKDVRLLHFSPLPFSADSLPEKVRLQRRILELQCAGEDTDAHHGSKTVGTLPAKRMKYVSHTDARNDLGRKLEITLEDGGLRAVWHAQFYDGAAAARVWTEVTNGSKEDVTMESVTSFALTGFCFGGIRSWEERAELYVPDNSWGGECQWHKTSLPQRGLYSVLSRSTAPDPSGEQNASLRRLVLASNGTWSTSEYLPMGCLTDTETGTSFAWQTETHGAWYAEMGEIGGQIYLRLSGPNETDNHWSKTLHPGESFVTVKAAVVAVEGGFERAMQELTKYRRLIRRPNEDNVKLPVIFNDYMNCLYGQPTTEKLFPLIDAAAKAGCEYFVIDAGWYADGFWWDGVGEWLPSKARFPGGIREPLDRIRERGMIPGLWMEIEVMGVNCPLADKLPDDWFFVRHGKRVIDHGRYQLDFRNPEVQKHADGIIDRLVDEYGAGYIKMDYNINAGVGTELHADSLGDGLLEHTRAYKAWLERQFERHPGVVIENCSSGGMRMCYGLLDIQSIQSTSDQTDYHRYASIAGACASAVTPEQAAVWSYPLTDGDEEETIFNMVNALLLRIHQSGHLANLSPERFAYVQEGITYYKSIRSDIARGLPVWPVGVPTFADQWCCFGLDAGEKMYIAVWRLESESDCLDIPLPSIQGQARSVRCAYPLDRSVPAEWNPASGKLCVRLPERNTARIFEITK